QWLHSVGFPDSRHARHTKTPGSDTRERSWVPNRSRAAFHRTHGRAAQGRNTRRPGFFAGTEGKDRFREASYRFLELPCEDRCPVRSSREMIGPKALPCAGAAPAIGGRPGLRGQSRFAPIPATLVPDSSEIVPSTPFRGYPEITDDLE